MKEKGIEEDIKTWVYGKYTIFQEASISGELNILKWLLHELKFDVNEKDGFEITALHRAASFNQIECARLLLDAGSQLLKDRWGDTPLDYAKRNGHKEMQRLIESYFQLS